MFDDPNLVSGAGLAPVLQLAERAGLKQLVADHVRIDEPGGGNAHLKVPSLAPGWSPVRSVSVASRRPRCGRSEERCPASPRAERRNLAQGSAGAVECGGYGFGRGVQRLVK